MKNSQRNIDLFSTFQSKPSQNKQNIKINSKNQNIDSKALNIKIPSSLVRSKINLNFSSKALELKPTFENIPITQTSRINLKKSYKSFIGNENANPKFMTKSKLEDKGNLGCNTINKLSNRKSQTRCSNIDKYKQYHQATTHGK